MSYSRDIASHYLPPIFERANLLAAQLRATSLSLGEAARASTSSDFFDDFNRADGAVGNGWSTFSGGDGNLVVLNGALSPDTNGPCLADIYRPIDITGSITISADLTPVSGSGLTDRFDDEFFVGSTGGIESGYGVTVFRSDNITSNSQVELVLNGDVIGAAFSPFQFSGSISVTFTVTIDHSISGVVSSGGSNFGFHFDPRSISYAGSNFEFLTPVTDPSGTTTYATVDNLAIHTASCRYLFDDFDRPDGEIGNGWSITSGDTSGDLRIENGSLTIPIEAVTGERAGIYRPIDLSTDQTVSTRITEMNGFSSLPNRYATALLFGSDGTNGTPGPDEFSGAPGYGIAVRRGDANYSDSKVVLIHDGVVLDTAFSTFQFGSVIRATVTYHTDGSITGSIEGDGNTFTFSFDARDVELSGTNFAVVQSFPDMGSETVILPTVDDVIIHNEGSNPGINLVGTGADDNLSGQAGDDYIFAQGGNDTVTGNDGSDVLYGGDGNDDLTGGSGVDHLSGGSGNDNLSGVGTICGGDGNDTIGDDDYASGGDLYGGDGDDIIVLRTGHWTFVDGGNGYDVFGVDGSFDTTEVRNIEDISTDFNVILADETVVAGGTLLIEAGGVDASAETDVNLVIVGNGLHGDHSFIGGYGNDSISIDGSRTGYGSMEGRDGDDVLTGDFEDDTFDGGSGDDLAYGGDGNDLGYGGVGVDHLTGGNGNDVLYGGDGNDTLVGNNGIDTLSGGLGSDSLNSGGGADKFAYTSVAESTSSTYDTIVKANLAVDKFDLTVAVSGIDATIAHGTLNKGNFDVRLAAAVNASHLGAHHAVVFTPDAGPLAGSTFLVVDVNGVAGYQASADLVFELDAATNVASLSTANFI